MPTAKCEAFTLIDSFLSRFDLRESTLVLDSTGPSLMKHYLILNHLGMERVSRFQKVHTFSGGTFALFGMHAGKTGNFKHAMGEYYQTLDSTMRKNHRVTLPVFSHALNFARQRSLLDSPAPLLKTIEYIFSDEYLNSSFADIAPRVGNVHAWLGSERTAVSMSAKAPSCDTMSMRQLILASTHVPFLYGPSQSYYDAAFSPGYRKVLGDIRGTGRPTLFVTPWKSGRRGDVWYVNPFLPANQKRVMANDLARLLMGIPNPNYARELRAIFG